MQVANNDNQELDLRASLEAAFEDKSDPVDPPAPAEPAANDGYVPPAEGENTPPKDGREYVRDEHGKFAPKEPPKSDAAPEGIQAAGKVNQPPAATPAPAGEPKAKDPVETAPQSWSPAEREAYKDMPLVAKQAAHRLEAVTQQTLRDAAEAKRFASEIQKTIAPYEHFLKAEGATAAAAIDNLFATAARLRTSTAPELAQLVTGLIQQYGVGRFGNGFIGQLDAALSGQAAPAISPEMQAMQQKMEAEMAPFRQWQQQMAQQQAQQMQQGSQLAEQHVTQFAQTAEFLNDVRMQMADIMDMGERNGVKYTLQQAYDIACRAHPEISRIMEQRERAKIAESMNQNTQKARNAAVGIGGAPALGGGSEQAPESIRDSILLAMNQNAR